MMLTRDSIEVVGILVGLVLWFAVPQEKVREAGKLLYFASLLALMMRR